MIHPAFHPAGAGRRFSFCPKGLGVGRICFTKFLQQTKKKISDADCPSTIDQRIRRLDGWMNKMFEKSAEKQFAFGEKNLEDLVYPVKRKIFR